jgi:hypothetical protein
VVVEDDLTLTEQPSDEEVQAAIEAQLDVVGPILSEMFKRAAEKQDYWLKGQYLQQLCDWIIGLQNMASMIEPLSQALAEANAELEELKPSEPKPKVFNPFA